MSRGTTAFIDLTALNHNFDRVRELVGLRSILAMVKSNGYGHGLLRVARTLRNADAFGVASIEEALVLRHADIQNAIFVMSGFYSTRDLELFSQYNLTPVIHHQTQLDILQATPLKRPMTVWMKLDTGMHRLGFTPDEFGGALARLQECQWVKQPVNVMTHLADAENPNDVYTQLQLQTFSDLTNNFMGVKSIANSAAILTNPNTYADWVRPGIMLYGATPLPNRVGEQDGLRPVMTLVANLIAVKQLKQGDAVGYNCMWRCPEDMPVGVVGIGYGDGYPRHAKSGTPVLINNTICPLVGRVSMDMIAVDLRKAPETRVGDQAVLWGNGLPIEKVAECAGTISYELLCDVTQRVEFVERSFV